jgi:hypothetical protein
VSSNGEIRLNVSLSSPGELRLANHCVSANRANLAIHNILCLGKECEHHTPSAFWQFWLNAPSKLFYEDHQANSLQWVEETMEQTPLRGSGSSSFM